MPNATDRIQAMTAAHRNALARLTNDALPPQTRADVLALAETYQGLLTEYIALQETVGRALTTKG